MPAAAGTRHASLLSGAADRIVIERGGRRMAIRLPRHGVAALAAALALLGGWSIAAAGYVFFHDAVVAELRQRSNAASKGYQAELAAMRDALERTRTKGLVERSSLDDRLAEILARQAAIEKRQSRLDALADLGGGAETKDRSDITFSLKPAPMDGASAPEEAAPAPGLRSSALGEAEKVASALDAIELDQARALEGVALKTAERRRTLERVYDAARLRRPAVSDGRARGGPFEPLPAGSLTFETRAEEIQAERAAVSAYEAGLSRAPIRTPAPGASISSGFGARPDPFLGRLAFHAGIDFERDAGESVRATAGGRVTNAGWSGGYGEMVEIDHGGGLATRYGHLSAVLVRVGDEVKIGSLLGLAGSTGRSTGPHLHYETRVNGEAVDPMRFLNAGRLLAAR
ncbi:MAG: M23 family peptidase [Ancylobacter novellus]|uniref:M23 family peptidase n=1 Tax=Ancylobacter novellus TaxID=921 RepID=A0A2W5KDF7_ANCNO|nr:MAG: M23 family peptidase [Ancylobacter novellus]